jgi:hypothetical protein
MAAVKSPDMAKKKSEPPPPPEKAVLYVELDPVLKERLRRLAVLHERKITGECIVALRRYVEEQEKAEGLSPLAEGGD